MGLTSHKVLALAALLAVVSFAATVWLWPRLARRSGRAVAGRIGLLFVTQVAVFASVGLMANNSFLFYGSWADLFGQEQTPGVVVDHEVGSRDVHIVGKQGLDVPGGTKPAVGGQIQKVVIQGRKSKIASPAYVYLPPQYFQQAYAKRTFPVSVVLTGYPGTAENLLKGLHFPRTEYDQVKAGKMKPMVLVMLRPTVAPPRDTECVDITGGPQSETFFAKDVPEAVRTTYRVGTGPRSWGFIGNSTGGYCALKLAIHHPNVYGAGAGLSAYYRAAEDPTTGDLFQGSKAERDRADLLWSLTHRPAPKTSLLVTTSKAGEGNYRSTMRFMAKVKPPTEVSSITLTSGGHNFNTWRREIPASLVWLSSRLTGR
ncbi:esterase family protein [Streptomyces sp. NBC_01387]|uniref:alpha/beta hydrolase n=1 Tax=unclassified Streptomyces TaxID=2593676 RepID=UPI002025949E|nr:MULTISPECIES: alpha/beta hydrolase-fold protein [unclassified Streptomyces]MCX4549151.1 esterase family protein [Streptomyces sp. NBC_01500]WSV54753.1 esterase family protein [Streptomyces sp. NBC_01014]